MLFHHKPTIFWISGSFIYGNRHITFEPWNPNTYASAKAYVSPVIHRQSNHVESISSFLGKQTKQTHISCEQSSHLFLGKSKCVWWKFTFSLWKVPINEENQYPCKPPQDFLLVNPLKHPQYLSKLTNRYWIPSNGYQSLLL